MSFSCPHFDIERDGCLRLKNDCIPGRLGCVLRDNSVFSVSADERVKERQQEKSVTRSPLLDPSRKKKTPPA